MQSALKKYGEFLTSQDILKFLALALMVTDHIGRFYFPDMLWFRVVGRLCVPIWFFFIGYSKSQTLDKQLFGGAILLIVLDIIYTSPIFPINILGTVILCRLAHRLFLNEFIEKDDFNLYDLCMLMGLILLFYLPSMVLVEYGSLALIFTVLGRFSRLHNTSIYVKLFALLGTLLFVTVESSSFELDTIETIVLGIGISAMVTMLYHYQPRQYTLTYRNPAIGSVMFFARNSLYFYVIHWIILLSIDRYLNPEDYETFSWINFN